MSLSTRRALGTVHPWLADRVNYILDFADRWSPNYTITSGLRTAQEQWALYARNNSSAVRPGCSQHQYGLAADVFFEHPGWRDWFAASAANFGLTTIPGDAVHVQAVPGSIFRQYTEPRGLCPDPNFPSHWFVGDEDIYRWLTPSPGPGAGYIQFIDVSSDPRIYE